MSTLSTRAGAVALALIAQLLVTPLLGTTPSGSTGSPRSTGGWGPAQTVTETFSSGARTAGRRNGSAVATWIALGGTLTTARRSPTGHWSHPVAVPSARGWPGNDDLAVGPYGRASVVWQDRVDGRWRVEESHLATGRWTRAHPLGWGEHPHTTIDGRGTTTVVWSARGIRSARRGTAGPWRYEPVARPSSPRLLRVASNADGDVATAWVERGRVRSALRPHGTGWTGASTFRLSPRELPIVTGVQVAVDRTGRALAVWSTTGVWHDRAHEYANYVAWSRSTPTGTWSSPRRVTRALGEDGGGLSMSMNPAGAALATWVRVGRSDSYASQWAARFRPDGTWTTPTRIPGKDVSWWGALAWLDPRGEAHAVLDRGWGNLVASYQPPGGRWSPGKVVAPGSALDADGRSRTFLVLYAPYHPGDTLRAIAWTAPR